MDAESECRLLALPAELRNRIYEFIVLLDLETFLCNQTKPRLFHVSRQLRDEYTASFYGSELLAFDIYSRESGTWTHIVDAGSRKFIFERCRLIVSFGRLPAKEVRNACEKVFPYLFRNAYIGIIAIQTNNGVERWVFRIDHSVGEYFLLDERFLDTAAL